MAGRHRVQVARLVALRAILLWSAGLRHVFALAWVTRRTWGAVGKYKRDCRRALRNARMRSGGRRHRLLLRIGSATLLPFSILAGAGLAVILTLVQQTRSAASCLELVMVFPLVRAFHGNRAEIAHLREVHGLAKKCDMESRRRTPRPAAVLTSAIATRLQGAQIESVFRSVIPVVLTDRETAILGRIGSVPTALREFLEHCHYPDHGMPPEICALRVGGFADVVALRHLGRDRLAERLESIEEAASRNVGLSRLVAAVRIALLRRDWRRSEEEERRERSGTIAKQHAELTELLHRDLEQEDRGRQASLILVHLREIRFRAFRSMRRFERRIQAKWSGFDESDRGDSDLWRKLRRAWDAAVERISNIRIRRRGRR